MKVEEIILTSGPSTFILVILAVTRTDKPLIPLSPPSDGSHGPDVNILHHIEDGVTKFRQLVEGTRFPARKTTG